MSIAQIVPKHQVTITKDVFEKLHLEVGDILDTEIQGGKLILVPKKLMEKAPVPKLSPKEQKLLARARQKIGRIRQDLASAQGLTQKEADTAARVGVIAWDQRWWWTEEWQRGEREAEQNLQVGRSKSFESAGQLIEDLRSR